MLRLLAVRISLVLLTLLIPLNARRYYKGKLADDCTPPVKFERDFRFFPEAYQIRGQLDSTGVQVTVADDFRVTYGESHKFVENLRVNETYLLYQCGTPVPNLRQFPENVKVFEIPLSSVALDDVTSSSFLAELNVTDRVKFVSPYATDACLQKVSHKCRRETVNPGYTEADPVLVRKQNRRTDAVFLSAATNNSESIAFTATMDPAVLNRAEWVKFVSLFFNKEPAANAFFDEIVESWNRFKMKATKDSPIVAWISFQDYKGDEFFIHYAPYKMEYITGAGAKVLSQRRVKRTNGVTSTTNGYLIPFTKRRTGVASLREVLKDVDVVIDETYQPNNTEYGIDNFLKTFGLKRDDDFPFLANKKVFRLDGLIGKTPTGSDTSDWYETAVARPDLVLRDLQVAIGMRRRRGYQRMWFRDLFAGELPQVIRDAECNTFKSCHAVPEVICPSIEVTCLGEISYRNVSSPCQQQICD
eukprot:g217.t1